MGRINLEKEFEQAGNLLSNVNNEDEEFNQVGYIQLMRKIRTQIRKKMRDDGVAFPNSTKTKLHPEICKQAIEIDKAIMMHSSTGQILAEFNATLVLYDLLNDYSPEDETKNG